jgi:hypothetical protein
MDYKDEGSVPRLAILTALMVDNDEDWLNAPDTIVVDQL